MRLQDRKSRSYKVWVVWIRWALAKRDLDEKDTRLRAVMVLALAVSWWRLRGGFTPRPRLRVYVCLFLEVGSRANVRIWCPNCKSLKKKAKKGSSRFEHENQPAAAEALCSSSAHSPFWLLAAERCCKDQHQFRARTLSSHSQSHIRLSLQTLSSRLRLLRLRATLHLFCTTVTFRSRLALHLCRGNLNGRASSPI